ncbi:P-II family nitrogen regulator [Lyngbya aestuarii]|uniref:P-II family nitrogen regulator n=1 Tax=Lyngbya aestuarii TaxID=118322 RepID=UPI00403D694B
MQKVQKVEIITTSLELEKVIELLEKLGVSGYTVIKEATGKGDRGTSMSDLGRVFSNSYIMTICTDDAQTKEVVKAITPILKTFGGVCIVTEAQWVAH